jgi:hypothetical protein
MAEHPLTPEERSAIVERANASMERSRRLIAAIEQAKAAHLAYAKACQEALATFEMAQIEAAIKPQEREQE